MSKWRPSALNCFYVIPDIHGAVKLLNLILDRILPLRKSDGGQDTLLFLGDYIDRCADTPLLLDRLIELEQKYQDKVIFLMGNHEMMFLKAFNLFPNRNVSISDQYTQYKMWVNNGGWDTIAGYLQRAGLPQEEIMSLPKFRILDLIPKEHIQFLQRLKFYHQYQDYIFVHGGMEPNIPVEKQDIELLLWDRSLVKKSLAIHQNKEEFPWEKIIIVGHSPQLNKLPIITEKFMMLDAGSPTQLLVVEINSMQAYMAYSGNKERLVKFELKEPELSPIPFDQE